MRPSNKRLEDHARIEAQIEAFEARGGRIQQCTSADNVGHKKRMPKEIRQRSFTIRHDLS